MNDGFDHITRELIKLAQQKEHLQELVIQAQEEFYEAEKSIAAARQTLVQALQEFNHLHTRIKDLEYQTRSEKPTSTIESGIYDLPSDYSSMSLWNKILFFVGEDDGWQTASEILTKVLEAEPAATRNDELKRKVTVNLYATLNNKVKTSEITREKINGEFVYSLPRKERQPSL